MDIAKIADSSRFEDPDRLVSQHVLSKFTSEANFTCGSTITRLSRTNKPRTRSGHAAAATASIVVGTITKFQVSPVSSAT